MRAPGKKDAAAGGLPPNQNPGYAVAVSVFKGACHANIPVARCVQTDLCRITMSGMVSDFKIPIRYKRALFTQKKLDRINFRSGKRGRVQRNPPVVTTGQWVLPVVGHVHGHMILCHMVLTRWQTQ